MSHPSRVRGLKHIARLSNIENGKVAPLTGAWIETSAESVFANSDVSHPSRVRGLKQLWHDLQDLRTLSHPSRVRGLKQSPGCCHCPLS